MGRADDLGHRLGIGADRDCRRRRYFAELAAGKSAKERTVSAEQVRRVPDIIIGSWCGKKFNAERVAARPGFDAIPAIRNRRLHEIKSP